jgi:hypothetical protein
MKHPLKLVLNRMLLHRFTAPSPVSTMLLPTSLLLAVADGGCTAAATADAREPVYKKGAAAAS